MSVREQVARLAAQYVDDTRARTGALPVCEAEDDWPSAAIIEHATPELVHWRPVPMDPPFDFAGLARALECPIHPDIVACFTVFWSRALPLAFDGNDYELLQLWNRQDGDNLIANFIGHALEKRRVREPLTLFFGLVDDSQFLCVENAGGAVVLETLGKKTPLPVSPNLADFLAQSSIRARTDG